MPTVAPHAPVLSELGLQPAAARIASSHSLPPPPPVRLPDIDPPPAPPGGVTSGGGGAELGGDGAAGAGAGAGAGIGDDDLLAPIEAMRAAREASARASAGGAAAKPVAGLTRGVSSVGTVISSEKSPAVMRMLEESVKK